MHPAGLAPGRLLLIRHGETNHNSQRVIAGWTDSPLSERGHRQASRLGQHVANRYRLHGLYASPLERARQTADAISRRTGLAPILHADLREIHFGQLEGLNDDQFAARFPDLYQQWSASTEVDLHWPDGESRHGFRRRVASMLALIEPESYQRQVAVVSHGGVIASYLAARLVGDPARWGEFHVRNCSITEIGWRDQRPILVAHNDVSHLGEE
jgi:broad specificity phosphatase PhoE